MSMEKLKKCRICLVENVRMYVVANKNLQEIYEKLTDVPFVTEDSRPMLACFLCCAKLKQCYQLQRKCLESEELFAQMLNDDCKTKTLINQDPLELYSWFSITPTVHISIVDECLTEDIAIEEEFPAVCEELNHIIVPMEEHQFDELELENINNSFLDVADIPLYHSESDLDSDVEFKIEVEEEQEVATNKRRANETTRAKKKSPDTRRTKLEDANTAEQSRKEMSNSKVIRTTLKRTTKPYCDKRSYNPVKKTIKHIRTQIGEKPYKCDVCQRCFSEKLNLTNHFRTHTGEKPFKCDTCGCCFSCKLHLTKHSYTHLSKLLNG